MMLSKLCLRLCQLNCQLKSICKRSNLFVRMQMCFQRVEFDIGRTHLFQHAIETPNNHPVRQAFRQHPIAYLPLIDEYVQKMQDNGEWVSNIVLVRKKDGALQYCIDYRGLNAVTTKANYPLPRIDACYDSLGGNTYFSSLDMRSGYWQVPVSKRDIYKTCFVTHKGIFGCKVLLLAFVIPHRHFSIWKTWRCSVLPGRCVWHTSMT